MDKAKSKSLIVFFCLYLAPLAGMGIDIYTPLLPHFVSGTAIIFFFALILKTHSLVPIGFDLLGLWDLGSSDLSFYNRISKTA